MSPGVLQVPVPLACMTFILRVECGESLLYPGEIALTLTGYKGTPPSNSQNSYKAIPL